MNPLYLEPDSYVLDNLIDDLTAARDNMKHVRIAVDVWVVNGVERVGVKYKIGEGVWTPPYFGDEDPFNYSQQDYYPVGIGNGL
jgi:hypothetical protein